jgi:hypothetical protein
MAGMADHNEALMKEIEALGGSSKCREIRANKKLACLGCVEVAATFVENVLYNATETTDSETAV